MDSASNSKPDSELVAEFQAGDGASRRTAFCALYQKYAGPIRSYLARRCQHEQLAEDLTQDCFLRALKGLERFEARSSVKTWLYCIATNLFRDHLRRRNTMSEETSTILDEHTTSRPGPDTETETNEEVTRVRRAVDALAEELREPLVLVKLQGLSYRDAAEVMGVTLNTVRMRIHRAHLKLAEELGGLK
ncbi:MAG: sigma-70 family RNA polymerase sigma factor [Planctomycetota bacterium]|nr:sigma-70 family RNA polymerase sigma factor [Planctomycetota bacterium]